MTATPRITSSMPTTNNDKYIIFKLCAPQVMYSYLSIKIFILLDKIKTLVSIFYESDLIKFFKLN